jgi:hypothetical protein
MVIVVITGVEVHRYTGKGDDIIKKNKEKKKKSWLNFVSSLANLILT